MTSLTNLRRTLAVFAIALVLASVALSIEPASKDVKFSRLRFFNTQIFGTSVDEPVVLLKPGSVKQLAPETIKVDVDKGRYFAATVQYSKKVSFAEARKSLNTLYAKHEQEDFADDPTMGLWRNEDDQFAVQLTEDENNITIIYIKYTLLSKENLMKGFSRALESIKEPDE